MFRVESPTITRNISKDISSKAKKYFTYNPVDKAFIISYLLMLIADCGVNNQSITDEEINNILKIVSTNNTAEIKDSINLVEKDK